MRRLTIWFTAVLAAVLLIPATGQASADGSDDPDPIGTYLASVDPTVLANQSDLQDFKTWLISQPEIYNDGFVESANDPGTRSTTLLWAGSGGALRGQVLQEAARRNIAATIQPVRFSQPLLQRAIDALYSAVTLPAWGGFLIGEIDGTDLTHDGLVVKGYYPDGSILAALPLNTTLLTSLANAVLSTITGPGGAPIDVAFAAGHAAELYTTRSTDFSPYYSGGFMYGPNTGGCTSGFAIKYQGVIRITTARHCNDATYVAYDARSHSYGRTLLVANPGAARVLTGAGSNGMFDGAWNNSSGFHKATTSLRDLSLNDYVCTSGANSGVHCNIKITSLSVYFNDGYGNVQTIRGIQQSSNNIAAAHGDSGGPVLVPNADGTTVGATGMIQATLGTQTSSCGSIHVATTCSKEVEFTSMRTIVNGIGATLYTGG